MTKRLLLILGMTALLLSGCATGYHSSDLFGGFTDKPIAKNEMQVTFLGNGYTTNQETYEYAMRRAAQQTLAHGFKYFEVVNQSNISTATEVYMGKFPTTVNLPKSVITYRFVSQKTSKAYDANKVLSQTIPKEN